MLLNFICAPDTVDWHQALQMYQTMKVWSEQLHWHYKNWKARGFRYQILNGEKKIDCVKNI